MMLRRSVSPVFSPGTIPYIQIVTIAADFSTTSCVLRLIDRSMSSYAALAENACVSRICLMSMIGPVSPARSDQSAPHTFADNRVSTAAAREVPRLRALLRSGRSLKTRGA